MTVTNSDKIDRIAEDVAIIKTKVDVLVEAQIAHRVTHEKIDCDIDAIQIQQTKNTGKIKTLWVAIGIILTLLTGGKFAWDNLVVDDAKAKQPAPIEYQIGE